MHAVPILLPVRENTSARFGPVCRGGILRAVPANKGAESPVGWWTSPGEPVASLSLGTVEPQRGEGDTTAEPSHAASLGSTFSVRA